MRLVLLLSVILLLPLKSQAAVFISEVAWMGSTQSANHEWIELYNDGAAVDVTGWTLSDGMNLNITIGESGSKIIPANSYVVLERSSDLSAPGPAFDIYTGALVNTGATLRLFRSDGSLVDQVAGGEDWKNIGGDNITKETAQYSTQGWKTAVATPGFATEASTPPVTNNESVLTTSIIKNDNPTQTATARKNNGGNESTVLTLPGVTLELDISAATFGYVNQPLKFFVEPSGIGETLINSLSYQWNFGDGNTSSAKDAQHIFSYPGTYLVTIFAGFKRQEQVARHEITILPVNISLTKNKLGDIQINNDSPYELNISGYKLKGVKDFIFPEHSILLPTQTITIKRSKIGAVETNMIALYDTETTMVAAILPASLANNNFVVSQTQTQPTVQIISAGVTKPSFLNNPDFSFTQSNTAEEAKVVASPQASQALASANNATPINNDRFIYLALVTTIGLAVLGVYLTAHKEN